MFPVLLMQYIFFLLSLIRPTLMMHGVHIYRDSITAEGCWIILHKAWTLDWHLAPLVTDCDFCVTVKRLISRIIRTKLICMHCK